MSEGNPPVLRCQLHQILFDFLRRLLTRKFQAVRNAEDMRIHYNAAGDAEGRPQNHVGGFSRDAGQGEQIRHGLRNLSAEVLHDLGGGADDAFGLVAEEARGMNLPLQFVLRQGDEIPGGGVLAEKLRRDFVHPLVRTLGREYGGDEKLEGVLVPQRAFCLGEERIERREDLLQAGGRGVELLIFDLRFWTSRF